jgi:uncharacterized protein YbjT (DUF2867 family)
VRAGTRDEERARTQRPELDWVRLDVEDEPSLDAAFADADAIVYLVHQMRERGRNLVSLERQSATRVRKAAERAGVRRIVYLGGPVPAGAASEHLVARLQTGEALRAGSLSTIELRAGMIIGAKSQSWLIVRDLALRLPVMVLPRWLRSRSQPIGIDDVVTALVHAITLDSDRSAFYDLPGTEILDGQQILERVGGAVGLKPIMIPVPVLTPRLSSYWLWLVTRADYGIARKLVSGLLSDLVSEDDGFWAIAPHLTRTPLDEAIRRALDAEAAEQMGGFPALVEQLIRRLRAT